MYSQATMAKWKRLSRIFQPGIMRLSKFETLRHEYMYNLVTKMVVEFDAGQSQMFHTLHAIHADYWDRCLTMVSPSLCLCGHIYILYSSRFHRCQCPGCLDWVNMILHTCGVNPMFHRVMVCLVSINIGLQQREFRKGLYLIM